MGFYKRYRDTFLVVLLLSVPFFFLRASISRPEEMNGLDRALLRVATPVQWFAGALARQSSRLVSEYVYLLDIRKDNDRLSREVLTLRNDVRQLRQVSVENERLKKLLGLKESMSVDTVSGVVSTKGTTEYFRIAHLVVDPGEIPVQKNMPVVSLDGVVGVVRRIEGDAATVSLVSDAGFGVDVVSSRTGARGFIRGTGDDAHYRADVELVQRSDELEVGDLLVTSGHGCRFPRGLPVAVVSSIKKKNFGSYQSVEARPTVDFSRLEEVLIIVGGVKDCRAAKGSR
ncbi:MAG: rod shape-determining protein MreC [Polyangiaceae bacterium]|nr:rod shape-determining protein MreC [Polyangiaceae bacterium]